MACSASFNLLLLLQVALAVAAPLRVSSAAAAQKQAAGASLLARERQQAEVIRAGVAQEAHSGKKAHSGKDAPWGRLPDLAPIGGFEEALSAKLGSLKLPSGA